MSVMAIVRITAHAGKGGEICDMLNGKMFEGARAAEGMLGLELFVGDQNPDSILIVEEWTSAEAHTRYLDSLGSGFDDFMKLIANRDDHHYEALD